MPDTTVVISNFNYDKYVSAAIASCCHQSIDCNIIIVDDCSTDTSWDVIKGCVKNSSKNIKAVRLKENSGGNARGKNVGICLSETKYITCLDSDDMLSFNSIKCRENAIGKADFIHGWSCTVKSNKGMTNQIKLLMQKFEKDDICHKSDNKRINKLTKEGGVRKAWFIEASTVLATKSLYERLGLYDEEMKWKIDREMWWRWLHHNAKYDRIDRYVSFYRKHDQQLTKKIELKNPKKCEQMMKLRQKQRESKIDSTNTLMMSKYGPYQFIGEIYE